MVNDEYFVDFHAVQYDMAHGIKFNTTDIYREYIKSGGTPKLTERQARNAAKKWYGNSHALDDQIEWINRKRKEMGGGSVAEFTFPYEVLFRVAY